jgi:hypothetical protein
MFEQDVINQNINFFDWQLRALQQLSKFLLIQDPYLIKWHIRDAIIQVIVET